MATCSSCQCRLLVLSGVVFVECCKCRGFAQRDGSSLQAVFCAAGEGRTCMCIGVSLTFDVRPSLIAEMCVV